STAGSDRRTWHTRRTWRQPRPCRRRSRSWRLHPCAVLRRAHEHLLPRRLLARERVDELDLDATHAQLWVATSHDAVDAVEFLVGSPPLPVEAALHGLEVSLRH